MSERSVYIAGPMRGYPRYNFDAFFNAERLVSQMGFIPINPERIEMEHGFDPTTPEDQLTSAMMAEFIARDVDVILNKADAIYMLKGWEQSRGAMAEYHLARWKGLEVFYEEPLRTNSEDILEEALRITRGDRNAQYGPPDQDFQRTASMWSALKGVEFTPHDVAMFMILLKCSRQTHQNKRDNWVDIAGYARCGSIIKTN
jgi:hypothetical protein